MAHYIVSIRNLFSELSLYFSEAQLTTLQQRFKLNDALRDMVSRENKYRCEQFIKEKKSGFRCGQFMVSTFKKGESYYIYNGTDYRRCLQNIKCKQQQDADYSRDITLELSKNPALFLYKNNPRLKFFSANHVGKQHWKTQSGAEFDPAKNGRRPLRVAPPNGVQAIDLRHTSLRELETQYKTAVITILGKYV